MDPDDVDALKDRAWRYYSEGSYHEAQLDTDRW
jgi:hypothetical protein